MNKKECNKCGYFFTNRAGNYARHIKSCDGNYKPYIKNETRKCKHCNIEFDISNKPKGWMANHSRWCDLNPKRSNYSNNLNKARNSKKNFNNQYTYGAICSEETKQKISIASAGRTHTKETKEKIRQGALSSPHRRLKKGVVEYKGILLDSSWELELAKRLDELKIEWTRPNPIPWTDENGVIHNYFPDFYLPEYNIYLDPKNKHAIKVQEKKLNILLKQYDNILIIDSLNGCKNFTV